MLTFYKACRSSSLRKVKQTLVSMALVLFLSSSYAGSWQTAPLTKRSAQQSRVSTKSAGNVPTTRAEKLYRLNCARCHGKDGKGTEGRDKMPGIPDFTNDSWQETRTDGAFSASILDGV